MSRVGRRWPTATLSERRRLGAGASSPGDGIVRDASDDTPAHKPRERRGSGAISVATFNALDGRGGGLESAARALNLADVDIAVVQETKIINSQYATKGAVG